MRRKGGRGPGLKERERERTYHSNILNFPGHEPFLALLVLPCTHEHTHTKTN